MGDEHSDVAPLSSRPLNWSSWRRSKSGLWNWLQSPEWASQWVVYFCSNLAFIKLLDIAGKLTIVISLVLYVSEYGKRLQDRHNAAWAIIVASRGISGDGGRLSALNSLYNDGVSLQGIALDSATLRFLDLHGANIEDAQFCHSFLLMPNFSSADMQNSCFAGATLIEPRLSGSNLTGSDFRNARLLWLSSGAPDLNGASLVGANFSGASIQPELPKNAIYCETVMPSGDENDRDCTKGIKKALAGLRELGMLPK